MFDALAGGWITLLVDDGIFRDAPDRIASFFERFIDRRFDGASEGREDDGSRNGVLCCEQLVASVECREKVLFGRNLNFNFLGACFHFL